MTRVTLVATAVFAGVIVSLQPAQAYNAPWCAVIETGTGGSYWDCQYRSFEDCYRRGNILAGNRGFLIRARTTSLDPQSEGRPGTAALARSSSSTRHVVNSGIGP
jgi:Protein of unknown function (DUF3551)